jgi:hypothetical protein
VVWINFEVFILLDILEDLDVHVFVLKEAGVVDDKALVVLRKDDGVDILKILRFRLWHIFNGTGHPVGNQDLQDQLFANQHLLESLLSFNADWAHVNYFIDLVLFLLSFDGLEVL